MAESLRSKAARLSFVRTRSGLIREPFSYMPEALLFMAHKSRFMARPLRFVAGKSSRERDWTPCSRLPARESFRSVRRLRQRSCQTTGAALPSLVKFVSFAACHAVVPQLPEEGG
jgi:hypothetical protein